MEAMGACADWSSIHQARRRVRLGRGQVRRRLLKLRFVYGQRARPNHVGRGWLIFGCVSLVDLYFPPRRATRIDPLVILRAG